MPRAPNTATQLLRGAQALSQTLSDLRFAAPVAHVYNPLTYAWTGYAEYVQRYLNGRRRIVLLGMNPGPYGMMQTGVPFGEVSAVRDWMHLQPRITPPETMHPRRPIQGLACPRSEVSGQRLWAWAAQCWGEADVFFTEVAVLNYCPLIWLEDSGRNRTPEQLPAHEMAAVYAACDRHLHAALTALQPQYALGIGGFAYRRLQAVQSAAATNPAWPTALRSAQILHPSPASPAANRGWATAVAAQLRALQIDCAGANLP